MGCVNITAAVQQHQRPSRVTANKFMSELCVWFHDVAHNSPREMLSPTSSFVELSGIHHLTAISAAIRENHRFYTQTLGMRLVKRTVNQDDVSAYHLFYADAKGSPGTDLTFFNWRAPRERRGTRSIVLYARERTGGIDIVVGPF